MATDRKFIGFYLPPALYRRTQRMARKNMLSVSDVGRTALEKYVTKWEQEERATGAQSARKTTKVE